MLTPAAARQLAAYNRWMNDKLYQAAASLPGDVLHGERGAFFGSLFGTLSHIVVGDTVWLRRFATLPYGAEVLQPVLLWPQPAALDARPAANLAELTALRQQLDNHIEQWAATLDEQVLAQHLAYRSMRGDACVKALGGRVEAFHVSSLGQWIAGNAGRREISGCRLPCRAAAPAGR